MVQLIHVQRSFVVTKYHETKSYEAVRAAFQERYPDRIVLSKRTIQQNVAKYQREGTSLNLNKGRSGRMRTVRTQENRKSEKYFARKTRHCDILLKYHRLSQVNFQPSHQE